MALGENVKRLRQQKKMTQAELARAVCITQAEVSFIEKGVRAPSVHLAVAMVRVLGVKPRELFE